MEVRVTPDLQAKLAQLASERGRDTEALVVEAVERMVNYDDWFIGEVEKGIAAADRDEFIEHREVMRTTLRELDRVSTRNQP
jgi:predicted transcriptional regulator